MTAQRLLPTRAPGLVLIAMLVATSFIDSTAGPSVASAPRHAAAIAIAAREPSPSVAPAPPGPSLPSRVRPAAGAVTGWFGEHRGSRRHPGVDFDGETGDPVWAAGAGTVVNAGAPIKGYSGYGTVVVVNHPDGYATLYAHLSSVSVTNGQLVNPGDRIGAIGTTGHVTGSHLHFEVRRDGGSLIDPGSWLAGAVPPGSVDDEPLWIALKRAVLPL
jgi:murein DD-endopeptidase MepM/ murein hydrolase activator NlpD